MMMMDIGYTFIIAYHSFIILSKNIPCYADLYKSIKEIVPLLGILDIFSETTTYNARLIKNIFII